MKKLKPNLKKMFNFHTIILPVVIFALVIEGRLQTKHNHHSHHNHISNNNNDVKQHHHQQHHSHHRHHQQHQLKLQHTTPSIEFTTSSSGVNSDNEFLIKQQKQQQHVVKDDFLKTENIKSHSSSIPPLPEVTKQNDSQALNFNSTTIPSPTLSNSVLEHTHQNDDNKLFPTPFPQKLSAYLSKQHSSSSKYSSNPYENSKLSLATVDQVTNQQQQQPQSQQTQPHHHLQHSLKKEYYDEQQPLQNDEDYYEDYNEDESDVVNEDDDNDGISDEEDNNLSDRSYARITRSKLDDDYSDDEPYRNGINDNQMQRDAAPGVLTDKKYTEVGNEKAVQQARERYTSRSRTPHDLATEHWHRMIMATKCRKPLPRVIPVSNNTSKRYEPYATILHRCGEDTGCCGSTASVCTVKKFEIISVYVFSYDFNYRKEIEALPMHNHTECHCVYRGSLLHDSMPRDKRSGGGGGGSNYAHRFQRIQQHQQQHIQLQSQSQPPLPSNNYLQHQLKRQNVLGCHCPRHFNVFEEDVERHAHLPGPHSVFTRKCRCDCLINNQTCLRFKHGEEGFSLEDRKCILENNCKPPVCSYGDYNLRTGRCPSYRSHLS